jgi:hypothetical protein
MLGVHAGVGGDVQQGLLAAPAFPARPVAPVEGAMANRDVRSDVDARHEPVTDPLRAGRGIALALVMSAALWGVIALVVLVA